MQTITKDTRQIIADMLTENTGRHMLDSGGAYGRNWERNQGLTVDDLDKSPRATLDRYGVTVNVYHYLKDNLTYAPELDALFQEYRDGSDEYDLTIMSEFITNYLDVDLERGWFTGEFNTYNYEFSALSQVLQGVTFEYLDKRYVLLQVHGGADVRGGYTAPKVFEITGYDELFPYCGSYSVSCNGDPDHVAGQLDLSGEVTSPTYHSWYFNGGDIEGDTDTLDLWELADSNPELDYLPCPVCSAKLEAEF